MTSNQTIDDKLDAVLAEYFQRLDAGEAVSPASLLESHPDLASQLREFFDAASFVENLAGPTQAEQTQMASVHDTARNSLVGETIVSGVQPAPRPARGGIGTHFGRYEIQRLLGQGAMGSVYLAYDPSLQRPIALKIPKFSDEANPDMRDRFLREARSAATLRHANICPVYDVGRVDGVHYITMAYIEGRTLAEELRAGRTFTPREIATVVRKLALALGKAHAAGVIHRDLKPGNIMLDAEGEPVLMDFGLAYREETDELRLTKSGMIVGSPAYMSPEQIDGDPTRIGSASDIYSLGVVLYEMITGKLPFQGTMMSVIGQIASKEPTPVGHYRQELADSPLERLCRKMLAKQPGDRPQTMQEVARALDYVLGGLAESGVGNGLRGVPDGVTERQREGGKENASLVSPSVSPSPRPSVSPSPPLPLSHSPTLPLKYPEAVLAQERRERAKMFLATTLILVTLVGLFGAAAAVVYVATDQGTLEITSHVDDVKIEVIGDNGAVKIIDLASGTTVHRLPSGEYSVVVQGNDSRVAIDKGKFTISRGSKVAVTAHLQTQVPQTAEAAAVAVPNGFPGSGPSQAAGQDHPTQQALAQRPPTLRPLAQFNNHKGDVRGVAFAPDDRQFASVGWDGMIHVYNTQSRELVYSWRGHDAGIYRARYLPDGRLITSAYDGTIKLWDVAKQDELTQLLGHTGPVTALAISADGKRALTSGSDLTVRLRDLEKAQSIGEVHKFEKGEWVWDAAFSPDGKSAATVSFDGKVRLFNADTGEAAGEFVAHQGAALSIVWVGDKQVLTGGRDGAIRLWDVESKTQVAERAGLAGLWIESLSISKDGPRALAGLANIDKASQPVALAGHCAVLDIPSLRIVRFLSSGMPYIYGTAMSSDGRLALLATGLANGRPAPAQLWDISSAIAARSAPAAAPAVKLNELRRLVGHQEYVLSVKFAREGKLLASGSADHSVMLWNPESGERVAFLRLHEDDVRSVAFTSEYDRFLTASNDKKVRIWDNDQHTPLGTLEGHTAPVSSVVVLPDGTRAISGSDDKRLIVWDLAERKLVHAAEWHTAPVSCLALSSDGKTIASAGKDNLVALSEWDGEKLVLKHRLAGHAGEIRSLAFSPDGRYVVSGSRDGMVRFWHVATGRQYKTLAPGIGAVYAVAISPGGDYLALGGGDWTKGAIKVYDFPLGRTLAEVRSFQGFVHALDFADDSTLAAGSADKVVTLWRLDKASAAAPKEATAGAADGSAEITEVAQIPGHAEHVTGLAVARDGQTIVSASADGTVLARDIEPRITRRAMSGHRRDRPVSVASSRDGRLFVTGDGDGKLRFARPDGAGIQEIDAHAGGVLSVTFTTDESMLLSTGCDNTAKIWNPESGELIHVLRGHTGWVCDGDSNHWAQAVTAGFDQTIRVWENGREVRQLPTEGGTAEAVAWAKGKNVVAAGFRDGTIRLFDPDKGVELKRFVGHTDRVQDVVFTPDGRHILSGSYDRSMRVWNVESGKQVAIVEHEKHIFNTLAVAPGGQHVFSAGGIWKPDEETNDWKPEQDYAIRMWRLPIGLVLPAAPPASGAVAEVKHVAQLEGHGGPVFGLAVTADGQTALSTSDDYYTRIWDPANRKQRREFKSDGAMRCVAMTADGTLAAWSGGQKSIVVWDLAQDKLLAQLEGHTNWVYSLQFTKDKSKLLSISRDGSVRLWDLATGQPTLTLETINRQDIVARLSPDETKILASSDNFYTLTLWNVANGQPLAKLHGHGVEGIYAAAFSPDGSQIATADGKGAIFLRDGASGEPRITWLGHKGRITALAFTPSGRHLVSGGFDGMLNVWDAQSGQLVARGSTGKPVTNQLAILPGGSQVLTAGGWIMNEHDEFQQPGDFAVHVWDLPAEMAGP